ncbi:MAG: hypothetical protein BGO14_03960 [Chlamydiales bacterium 38-26]|mgnify:FL=1|nr:hypothetical protein [Chlamydiales bacterium]OJV07653.1 MAG: hypothetical protein BGO14_03960 [Chlamydiales bacterium 38-26]
MQPLTLQPYFMPTLPNPFSPQSVQKPTQEISCSITLNIPTILSQQPPLTLIFTQTINEQPQTDLSKVDSVSGNTALNPKKRKAKKIVMETDPDYSPKNDHVKRKRRKTHNKENKSAQIKDLSKTALESNGKNYTIKKWDFIPVKNLDRKF